MQFLIKLIKKTYGMAKPQESNLVLTNVASLSGLQAITYLLPVIVLPYLFRVIGAEKFGLIAFAQAFVQYFMIVTDYGFNVSATKEISIYHTQKSRVRTIFSSVMTAKILLGFLNVMILSVILSTIPKFKNDQIIYILSFGAVLGNVLFPSWFFQGIEKMKYIANLNIAGELILALFIFTFVRSPQDYVMVPLIMSSVSIAIGIVGQYIVLRRFGIVFKFQGLTHILHQLKNGWNIFISITAINAYTTTRIFAVGLMTNNTLTGYYSVAEKIANVVQTFPLSSFSQALFPRLSKIYHKNKLKALKIMQQLQLITIIISLICLPVIFVFSQWLVRLACGADYPATVLSLRLLLVSVFFISSNAFRVQFLLVCGKTREYSRIHITMALIGLPLIIILISKFSYVGAAFATVAIEGGIFTLTYLAVKSLKFSARQSD